MALSYVGGATGTATDGNNTSVSLPVGTAQNDVVYCWHAYGDLSDKNVQLVTSGYTELADLYANDTRDTNAGLYRKVQGATPDSTVSANGGGNSSSAVATLVHVWRGADTTTPEDATTTTATGINTGQADPPSITTVTNDAVVLAFGACSADETVTNTPTGYSNLVTVDAVDAIRVTVVASSKSVATAGAEDPGVYTDLPTTTSFSWCAATVAIRPAGEVDPSATAALSLPSFTMAASGTGPDPGYETIIPVGNASDNANNETSCVVTHGLTINEDDLILFMCSSDGSASNVTLPTNDGNVQSTDYAASETLITARKVAGASEPSTYTFSFSTGERAWCCVAVYRNVDTTSPIESSNQNSTGTDSTSATFTSLTPGEDGCAVVTVVGTEEGSKTFSSWPSTITERNDNTNGPPGSGSASASGGFGDVVQTTATAVSGTVTISQATSWATHVIALKPKATASGPTATASPSLSAMSMTASAEQPYQGAGALSLRAAEMDAGGYMQPEAVAAVELAAASLTASGEQPYAGTGAPSLEPIAVTAIGSQPYEAVGSAELQTVSLAASGDQAFVGTASAAIEALSLAASALALPAGVGALDLGDVQVQAAGDVATSGTASAEIAAVALAAVGVMYPAGTADAALASMSLVAQGAAGEPEAVASLSLAAMGVTTSGWVEGVGTGAMTLEAIVMTTEGVSEAAEEAVRGGGMPPSRRGRRDREEDIIIMLCMVD